MDFPRNYSARGKIRRKYQRGERDLFFIILRRTRRYCARGNAYLGFLKDPAGTVYGALCMCVCVCVCVARGLTSYDLLFLNEFLCTWTWMIQ